MHGVFFLGGGYFPSQKKNKQNLNVKCELDIMSHVDTILNQSATWHGSRLNDLFPSGFVFFVICKQSRVIFAIAEDTKKISSINEKKKNF